MPSDLFPSSGNTGLQPSPIRGLHVTPAAPLPFLKGVAVRSFVLEREGGTVLIYNAPGIDAAARDILALGPLDRLLLNHCHEGMYGAPELDVPIFVHEADRRQTDLPVAGTFSARGRIGNDIEIVPTPGHTPGTTAFLWDNGERRLLFPGDSVWVQGGEWKAVLLGESDRAAYLASLATLLDLEFDVLVPWGSEDGRPYGYVVDRQQAVENLQRIIGRLKAGENA